MVASGRKPSGLPFCGRTAIVQLLEEGLHAQERERRDADRAEAVPVASVREHAAECEQDLLVYVCVHTHVHAHTEAA